MKTVLFTYESPIGTFWIHPEPDDRVQLRIDRTRLKTYSSPKAAAHDVYNRATGWEPWDKLRNVAAPASLLKWKKAKPAAAAVGNRRSAARVRNVSEDPME